ncbi:cytochrome c, partial [Granulosicoccus sp.]|nr:cytochrome c [Granulosicoccus sp.]
MGTCIRKELSTRCCAFRVFVVSTLLCLIPFALPVSASSGLAEYEKPWEICALCHSLDGDSRMAKFPKLAGQPELYIEKQLQDFLTGSRFNDGGQMSSIVTEVAEEDFQAIAIWFASQNPPLPNVLESRNRN